MKHYVVLYRGTGTICASWDECRDLLRTGSVFHAFPTLGEAEEYMNAYTNVIRGVGTSSIVEDLES